MTETGRRAMIDGTPLGRRSQFATDFEDTAPVPNDALKPISLVCKPAFAAGRPCVKLSDNPNKAVGEKREIAR